MSPVVITRCHYAPLHGIHLRRSLLFYEENGSYDGNEALCSKKCTDSRFPEGLEAETSKSPSNCMNICINLGVASAFINACKL